MILPAYRVTRSWIEHRNSNNIQLHPKMQQTTLIQVLTPLRQVSV
jgi:hypothetical protein